MKSEITIRTLSPSDARIFWDLRLKGLREEPHAFTLSYDECKDEPLTNVEKKLVDNEDSFIMGAFDGTALIGVTGFYRYEGEKVSHKGVVWGVYLIPEYRGKGIAKSLLLEVIAKAKKLRAIELLHLGVNPAPSNIGTVKLYESVGFTKWCSEKNALKVAGEYVDEDQMVLFL